MHLRLLCLRRSLLVVLAAAAVPWGAACSGGDDDDGGDISTGECAANLLAGDLVISEVMANPDGEDDGKEYFEIFNAGSAAVDLEGLTLAMSPPDGGDEKTHTMGAITIEPGDYLVLGAVETEIMPEYVDYGFDNDLGSLRNAGAVISLRCGDAEVDTTEYPSAETAGGVSYGLDGNQAPDHLANDDVENFCPATTEFEPGLFGSPGEANEPCNIVVSGVCNDGGEERATVPPQIGDLVVTEFLANPTGADTGKEWFEVYVSADVDLNGVVAGLIEGMPKLSVDSEDCVPVSAGTYLLFAGTPMSETNGGLPPVDQVFNFTLKNGETSTGPGSLYIGIGDQVLDAITYVATVDGQSTALDPTLVDPTANDDVANWFNCSAPYGEDGNSGTPGADNATCDVSGMCRDGDSFRPPVAPGPGDLRITEALSDPALTGNDGTQEWFEVEALASFDLNGLEVGENDDGEVEDSVISVDCLPVTSGDLIVFAQELKDNGGLPQADFELGDVSLVQDNGRVFVGFGGVILDEFFYGTTRDGVARALSADGDEICDAEDEYGDAGNVGSPGDPNPASATGCTPN